MKAEDRRLIFTDADAKELFDRYEEEGSLARAFPLADTGVISELRRDLLGYQVEVRRNREQGLFRVPYLITQAIVEAAHDENILAVVRAIMGTDELVMWGPNIQTGTPNEADLWHTDIESWLWPTVTVVVGLKGCHEGNTTRCIPGSHRLPLQPWAAVENNADASIVSAAARALDPACNTVRAFAGFADAHFYLFNARSWHCGVGAASLGRELLFLHYDRADNPRIPYMKDYEARTWFDFPAAYLRVAGRSGAFAVRRDLYSVEGKDYVGVAPSS
jgi:hypothetical protein